MKHLDEFRDPGLAQKLVDRLQRTATRRWTIMEVCGGQTHSLLRYGIEESLEEQVDLVHGPGCPVCVTPRSAIDFAQHLARECGVILTSFGDMLRVPGGTATLLETRAAGADVRMVYSPLDAVQLARRTPDRQVVFFSVGFETTAPATALAVLQAQGWGLSNFSVLSAHVRVEPAMRAILQAPGNRVQGFLAAGHVCTVDGYESYSALAAEFGVPIVVAGFEPVDLLRGLLLCVGQLEAQGHDVLNAYDRSVRPQGNPAAREIVSRVYEIADRPWRGLGVIPRGGLRVRDEFADFDAERRFPASALPVAGDDPAECRSAEVLSGRIKPHECESFGGRCTPDSPLGAPMVSSEGACAAYFRYRMPQAVPGQVACPLPR